MREGLLGHNTAPYDTLKTGLLDTVSRSIKNLNLSPLTLICLTGIMAHCPTNLLMDNITLTNSP
jgi:hypothetical protein